MKTARQLQKKVNAYQKAHLHDQSPFLTFEETCRVINKAAKVGNCYSLVDQMSDDTMGRLKALGYSVREIDTGYCSMPCYMVKWGFGMGDGKVKDEFDDWNNPANFLHLSKEESDSLTGDISQ